MGKHKLTYFGYMMRKDGPEKEIMLVMIDGKRRRQYQVKEMTRMGLPEN